VAEPIPRAEPILRAAGLTKRFGGLAAVNNVDLDVARGHVHAIIGPNGAGKTTIFNLVSGFLPPDGGSLWLDGREITRLPVYGRTALGIVRTFQNIRLFRGLTVLENVLVGQHTTARPGFFSIWPVASRRERELHQRAEELLELFHLADDRERLASELPYGAQKRLEMARALAAQPSVLLLDEPTAGMNERESEEIAVEIAAIRARGVTVVLVEHDMNVVMGASDVVTVLSFGEKIAEGTPDQVQADPAVRLAYLGEESAE
jgi:branched-chain amino acid transport system ATP-binding protein